MGTKEDLGRADKHSKSTKHSFKIWGLSRQPRISLQRGTLKELNILAKRGDLEKALL